MFTIFIVFVFITIVGATLLLDNIPGNDDIGEFFVGAGTVGIALLAIKWGAA